jgi:DNA-binding CsgD family transcriptional regulator
MAAMKPRLRIPWPSKRSTVYGTPLTHRQLQVIAAVASADEKNAAHELGLSVSTIKSHMSEIGLKLGVEGGLKPILFAIGWLVLPDDRGMALQVIADRRPALKRSLEDLRSMVDVELARLDEVPE